MLSEDCITFLLVILFMASFSTFPGFTLHMGLGPGSLCWLFSPLIPIGCTHAYLHTHTHTPPPIALLLVLSGIVDPNHLGITRNKAINYFSWFHFLFPWSFLCIFYFFNIFYMYACACSVKSDSLGLHDQAALSIEFSRQEYWSGLPFSYSKLLSLSLSLSLYIYIYIYSKLHL